MQKTAIILMIVTILSKILGFVREQVMAYFYGTGDIANAFVTAFGIPTIIFNFVVAGVITGYIPMISRIEKEQNIQEGNRFTSNLLNLLFILAALFFVIGLIFTAPIVKIFAIGYEGERLRTTIYLTRFMMIAVFGTAYYAVFRGYLNYKNSFIVPASNGFIMNIFTIAAIIFSAMQKNLFYLGFGSAFALLIQYVFFVPTVRKTGFKYSRYLNRHDPNVKHLIILAMPIILGVAVEDVNRLIDKTLASVIAVNGPAVMNFAVKLLGFVSGIVIVSITTAIFPSLARMAEERKIKQMKKTFTQSISLMNLLVFPSMVGFMLYAEPIVNLIFVRGEFTQQDGIMVASALFMYAPSLIGIAYRDVLSRMFYAMHDTKTPAVNAALMVIVNVFFSIVLSRFIGLNGLALGTTIASSLGAFLLMQTLRVRMRGLTLSTIFQSSVKIIISTAIMGVASYAAYIYLAGITGSDILRLFVGILVAMVVYGLSILILKVEEGKQLIDLLAGKIRRH